MKPLDEEKAGGWNNHWRGTDRPTMRYELFGYTPESGQWRWAQERSQRAVENYERMLIETGCDFTTITQDKIDDWYLKQLGDIDLLRKSANGKAEHYIAPTNETLLNSSWMDLLVGSSSEISQLFTDKVFDTAKLSETIMRILRFAPKDALVLDFFSGSATTAHAVMQLNAEDGGSRKFIMVQIPEECNEKSDAYQVGYKTVCEIGEERIRRAGKKILDTAKEVDTGFRIFKIDSTNMKDVYYAADEITQQNIMDMASNIKEDRTSLDLLFGCLLEWGLPLSLPYTSETIDSCTVHTYNDGDLIACFDENIPDSVIKAIANRQPLRAVFRDRSFADSPAKINVGEIFKLLAPDTRVKVI